MLEQRTTPETAAARFAAIPEKLRKLSNWVLWRREKRFKKDGSWEWTKTPYQVRAEKNGKHRKARSNDPSTWATYEEALAAFESGAFDGLGFCLSDLFIAVDLDGCILPDGTIEPWAQQIMDELTSYAESSPNNGIHIIVKGQLPEGRRQCDFKDRPHHGVALYEAGGPRYVTMTGNLIGGVTTITERTQELGRIHARYFPPEPPKTKAKAKASTNGYLADDELIERALRANDGGKFQRLWSGRWEGDYASQSEADLALCMKLAFWTGRDGARIDGLFRESGLMRDKWDREDYRERTIAAAIERTTETWKGPPPSNGTGTAREGPSEEEPSPGGTAPAPALTPTSETNWRGRLLLTKDGGLLSCIENASLLIENDSAWNGVLGHNLFTGGYHVMKPPPKPVTAAVGTEITDVAVTQIARWLERRGVLLGLDKIHAVIDMMAEQNPFHPVQEHLNALPPWDKVERLDTWLRDYCGVIHSDESPNYFAMVAGRKFLISAVARVFEPGCKVDHVLILEGPQGSGRSTAVRILAGDEFYSDQLSEIGGKDASMQIRGVWIMELAELEPLLRAESPRAKAFFTRQTERFRLPYGRRLVTVPRQVVFIGTVNADSYLTDESGNRRYWPVLCTKIKLDELRRDRNMLLAEALHAYRAGEHWHLEDKTLIAEATAEQYNRLIEDPWCSLIAEHLTPTKADLRGFVPPPITDTSVPEILRQCIDLDCSKWDQRAANRVARCLKVLRWKRYRSRDGEDREWRYRRAGFGPT
jgi:predicted P-loop ATPase